MLKQPVITKVAGERSKKAQSRELLKSVAVSVSPKLKKIARYNKTNNRKMYVCICMHESQMKPSVLECKISKDLIKQDKMFTRALLRAHKIQMDPIPRKRRSKKGLGPNGSDPV